MIKLVLRRDKGLEPRIRTLIIVYVVKYYNSYCKSVCWPYNSRTNNNKRNIINNL